MTVVAISLIVKKMYLCTKEITIIPEAHKSN